MGVVRTSRSLDGEWRFIADPERLHDPESLPEGEPIMVPGPWESQVSRPYRIITAWYRRTVDIPDDWRADQIVLRFGAVMYRCTVWLNGRSIGGHEGGYLPFELDATEAAHAGENVLVVQVVNPLNGIDEYPAFSVEAVQVAEQLEPDLPLSEAPHGKQTWYSSTSGIWQSVHLERRPRTALGPLQVRPDVETSQALVRWTIRGDGGLPPTALELIVRDPDGADVTTERIELGETRDDVTRVAIPEPRLWDIDQPNLYTVEATLIAGNEPVDRVSARFGMRTIATSDGRLLLNGRPIYMLAALDQDHYPDTISTPPSRAYLDEQMRLTREMGINVLRCHIKVPDPAYLDAADEAGILVWAELPNWTKFTSVAGARGRQTLEQMVEELGNHPSIVIWTIINEDWGTQLRYEARDRHWLRDTYHWLKALDPTRLVVDNSACETPQTPNFHLATDLADFHVYFLAPDNAIRWRKMIEDFARRPQWLWSPHGDAQERGDEPLILSEFGSWGLPRLDRLFEHHGGREPWWFATGRDYYRPTGIRRRFTAYGLDRIWDSVDDLAEATQWHQFEAMQYEIGQMRRHDSIQGYVITELTDAYWEANGLLDAARGPKAYHGRLKQLNNPDVVVADLGRRDLCGLERLHADLYLSSYGGRAEGGRVRWQLVVDGRIATEGELPVEDWPDGGTRAIGSIDVDVPDVARTADAELVVQAIDGEGRERTRESTRVAILPSSVRTTDEPLGVSIVDPLDIWGVTDRVASLGHRIVPPEEADLFVATELTDELMDRLDAGGRALILVRTRAAIPEGHDLARRVSVHLRRLPHAGWPGQRSPWEGDWVTSWSWILHDVLTGLPLRNPLDFAYEEVLPDHVLLGYDPGRHRDEVAAGMFVGWVRAPAALHWTFRQGRGAVTLTTLRVAPETGPVATALLEQLIRQAATADRRTTPRALELTGASR